MSYAIAILGLLVLIFIHELGHFAAAKAVGMRALNFTIGFPPIIAGKQYGDTEYRIGAIPLGGYVKIPGMLRPEADDLYAIDDLLERPDQLDPAEGLELSNAVDEFRLCINRNQHDAAAVALERVRAAGGRLRPLPDSDRPAQGDQEHRPGGGGHLIRVPTGARVAPTG